MTSQTWKSHDITEANTVEQMILDAASKGADGPKWSYVSVQNSFARTTT